MTIWEQLQKKLAYFSFGKKLQQSFLEDLSSLVEDGVPASQAVETIAELAPSPTRDVAISIMQKIAEGRLLADGMENWFAPTTVEIIRAGEEGGTLSENLTSAAKSLGRQTQGLGAIINTMLYPIMVLAMGLGVAVFIKDSVLTSFAGIKPVAEWPSNGQILLGVASFFSHWWWLVLLVIVAIILVIVRLLTELTGPARQWLDDLPVFSLYREATAARVMETLGMLLTNGIVLKRALTILRNKANNYLAWHLYVMELRLSGGRENIADVIDTGLISKADILRLRLVAKGKGFEHALVRLGRLAAERNSKNIELTGKIAGIILLIMGAGWAAFMVLAIYGVGSFIGSG